MEKVASRNIALDVLRCLALFCVIAVHFFLNSGFYTEPVLGFKMYIMVLLRVMFTICVPLFMMLSGYLLNTKKLSKSYYTRLLPVIVTYVLSSLFCAVYSVYIQKSGISFVGAIANIFSFSTAPYSWYVEMYLGLYLLIPFLNILYHNLNSKKQKTWLLVSLLLLTTAPSALNIFRIAGLDWWLMPSSNYLGQQILPEWWTGIYPLTYYFLGCYLKEYPISLSIKKQTSLLILTILVSGSFCYYRSYPKPFYWGPWIDYYSPLVTLQTILTFSVFEHTNYTWMGNRTRSLITKISTWSLGAYLVSSVYDDIIYTRLRAHIPVMQDRLIYFLITVPVVFILSTLTAGILDLLNNLIFKLIHRLQRKQVSV